MRHHHAHAARACATTDGARVGRAVDAQEGVAVAVKQVKRTRAQRVLWPCVHALFVLLILVRFAFDHGFQRHVFDLFGFRELRQAMPALIVFAKAFFDGDEWRMINGVLDHIARNINADDPSLRALDKIDINTDDLADIAPPEEVSPG